MSFRTLQTMPSGQRRLIAAVAALAAAVEVFGWFGIGGMAREKTALAVAMMNNIRAERPELEKVVQSINAKSGTDKTVGANDFLNQLDGAIARNGVHVVRIVPQSKDEKTIDIDLRGGFSNFLRFASEVEAAGGTFHDLRITRSHDGNVNDSSDDFSFSVAKPAGRALRGQFIDDLRATASDSNLRDIFAPLGMSEGSPVKDLSNDYKLSAVTQFGQYFVATIDGLDFRVGDKIGPRIVAEITADSVTLTESDRRFVLHFQRKDK